MMSDIEITFERKRAEILERNVIFNQELELFNLSETEYVDVKSVDREYYRYTVTFDNIYDKYIEGQRTAKFQQKTKDGLWRTLYFVTFNLITKERNHECDICTKFLDKFSKQSEAHKKGFPYHIFNNEKWFFNNKKLFDMIIEQYSKEWVGSQQEIQLVKVK